MAPKAKQQSLLSFFKKVPGTGVPPVADRSKARNVPVPRAVEKASTATTPFMCVVVFVFLTAVAFSFNATPATQDSPFSKSGPFLGTELADRLHSSLHNSAVFSLIWIPSLKVALEDITLMDSLPKLFKTKKKDHQADDKVRK